jgi:uncharacterized protein (TIGR00255 family)
MSLASMTGFARAQGVEGSYAWAWEIKSVNGKGLDLRLRLPPSWDGIESMLRAAVAGRLARGNVSATLDVKREGVLPSVRVNAAALNAVLGAIQDVSKRLEAEPPRLDGLLALKGVIEIAEAEEEPAERARAEAAVVRGFEQALAALVQERQREGRALGAVLAERIETIARLTGAAEDSPARKPEAIRTRLAEQVKLLLSTGEKFDSERLHQEAVLLAAKSDVREELDRLSAHVAAARSLLRQDGAVGRRLDFLAQELNREANTLCAKANDVSLTAIGLELRAVVDQFREQVQNLE